MMYSESLVKLGKVRSEIREIFEYGNKRKAEIGAENVFDFSIGNPSVPAPKIVDDTIKDLVDNFDSVALHGYTSAQGDAHVRQSISDYINGRFGTKLTANHIYMTCGAASSLTIVLNAIMLPGEECIAFTPYFPEYGVFIERTGAKLVAVQSEDKTFLWRSLKLQLMKKLKQLLLIHLTILQVLFTQRKQLKKCVTF